MNDPEDDPLGREVKGRELPPVGLEEPASAAATASAMAGERAAITPWTIEFSFLEEGAAKDLDGVEKELEGGAETILVLEAGAEKSWGLAEARERTEQTRTTEGDMLQIGRAHV